MRWEGDTWWPVVEYSLIDTVRYVVIDAVIVVSLPPACGSSCSIILLQGMIYMESVASI